MQTQGLESRLQKLIRLADEAGAESVMSEALALSKRLSEGRFNVACIGQFKRGKSTLLNALVGQSILPVGVIPVTTVITILRYGDRLSVKVQFKEGRREEIDPANLSIYVSEVENPENQKGVAVVEVFSPSPLLASGMCLVDTPGIGSVFAANTAVTQAFVPHIDAVLVVLGADPPLSGEEMGLIEEIAKKAHKLIFILNKADRLSDSERKEARVFAERVLTKKLGRNIGSILEVSAAERISLGRPTRDWEQLEKDLRRLAHESGADLVRSAEKRGVEQLMAQLLRELEQQRESLLRPLEESERRLETLRECVKGAERALTDLAHLFNAEQEKLFMHFTQQRKSFLAKTLPQAEHQLKNFLRGALPNEGKTLREAAVFWAQKAIRREVETWFHEMEPLAEELYRKAIRRFVELAHDFLERLSGTNQNLIEAFEHEMGFRNPRHFYFTEILTAAPLTLVQKFLDRILPARLRTRWIARNLRPYLERLLTTNSSRVEGDLDERVLESRRLLESEIRNQLKATYRSAEHALEKARVLQAEGAQAVQVELQRISGLKMKIENISESEVRA